jgi:thiol-disulfide isomerase/thioredoxin
MKTLYPNHRILLPIAIGCLLCSLSPLARAGTVKVGESFPDMAQFQFEGKLPDALRGKVVLVDFWASWCGPCKGSFPALEELHKRYAGQGLVVLGINLDETKEAMQEFLAKHPASFAIVRDHQQKMVKTVSISTMPTSFILDSEGKVRFIHNGFHGASTQKQYAEQIEQLLKTAPLKTASK